MSSVKPPVPRTDRYAAVAGVLFRVLLLNLAVAIAKIAFGYASGAISILSDGFHSLTDAASNIAGLIGVRAASQPPDDDHPYGHRKYETVAAAAVTVFLMLLVIEVVRNAFNTLTGRAQPHEISTASFLVMLVTVAVNLAVVAYESRAAERLGSEVLLADAMQTRGDVWSSLTVIAALVGARLGLPILDPLAALVVAGFIGYAGYQVARATTGILSDRIVISDADLEQVVMSVPGVIGCEKIRTRGSSDHVFLDMHVWMPPDMSLHDAHDLSHVVKDRLMARYPQIADAVIHIEPPPEAAGPENPHPTTTSRPGLDPAIMTFDEYELHKTSVANAAEIAPLVTERDEAAESLLAIGNPWSRALFGGLFYLSNPPSSDAAGGEPDLRPVARRQHRDQRSRVVRRRRGRQAPDLRRTVARRCGCRARRLADDQPRSCRLLGVAARAGRAPRRDGAATPPGANRRDAPAASISTKACCSTRRRCA